MKVLGHRGLTTGALENTLPAFEDAVACGIEGVELDVQLARCGTPIVFHDDDLERLFGRPGYVTAYTAAELREFRPPRGSDYPDAFIPTLAEVLEVFPPGYFVNVELKAPKLRPRSPASAAAAVIDRFPQLEFLISSFNPFELVRYHRIRSGVRYGLLFDPRSGPPLRYGWSGPLLAKAGLYSIHPNWRLVSPDLVERNHRRGLEILVWTVNEPATAVWLRDLGVQGIISDVPEEMKAALVPRTT